MREGQNVNKRYTHYKLLIALQELLSCAGKGLERVINRRLVWHIQSKNLLSPTQTDYRQHRSTGNQLAYLAQDVEHAYQESCKQLPYPSVQQGVKGLLLKLLEISGHMYRWTKHILLNRTAKVKDDGRHLQPPHHHQRGSAPGRCDTPPCSWSKLMESPSVFRDTSLAVCKEMTLQLI